MCVYIYTHTKVYIYILFKNQIQEYSMEYLHLAPLSPEDRIVQFGKTRFFSKVHVGSIAHPGVIFGFPIKD